MTLRSAATSYEKALKAANVMGDYRVPRQMDAAGSHLF